MIDEDSDESKPLWLIHQDNKFWKNDKNEKETNGQ